MTTITKNENASGDTTVTVSINGVVKLIMTWLGESDEQLIAMAKARG